jgi:nucleotide-binding universal stress UspA family protein
MFQPKNILVPTDFSEHSDRALQTALDLAAKYISRIFLLHVIGGTFQQTVADYHIDQRTLERILNESILFSDEKLRETIDKFPKTREIKVIPEVCKGFPQEEILTRAAERGVDLIVIASHGKTGLKKYVIGSVAEKIMKEAKCPVLLIRS